MGVRVERADMRWVGARRKKSTHVFLGGGVLGVGRASHSVNIWAFELILLFTSVDGLFCLGPRETITTSTVETLYNYPEKQLLLVQWIHYRLWLLLGHRNVSLY